MSKLSWGDSLYQKDSSSEPIVEHILWERDVVMLLGSEKAGKSVLAHQLACAITSGTKFLDKFKVPNPHGVIYLQSEGKEEETIDRMMSMTTYVACDKNKFARLYKKFFPIDVDEFKEILDNKISELPFLPKVMFVDAIYMSMIGDLIDNKEVRKFIANISAIVEKYKMTCVLVHHESKEPLADDGSTINRGDKGSYGSIFLRAWVDHILYLKKVGKITRTFSCDTQRSGKIMTKEDLVLIDNPLHFEIRENVGATAQQIHSIIKISKNTTVEKLAVVLGLAESTIKNGLRELLHEGKIVEVTKGEYGLK